ncbi:MAG: sugar O-acetyltransferase [Acholeplasmatales bacterium]|nr:sugar O-acetyltransferase [Acholeplasmatales bacterium]
MKRNDAFDKLLFSEEYYDCNDKNIINYQLKCINVVNKFNKTKASPSGLKKRSKLLNEMFGSIGKNAYIEPPIHSNYGCKNCFIGDNFYANFNLALVDDGKIIIGNNVLIGPNCTLATPVHPMDVSERLSNKNQKNLPIIIEDNVWIASNVVILPGVKIGKNSVIGAGSVVTKDVLEDSFYCGNPASLRKRLNNK